MKTLDEIKTTIAKDSGFYNFSTVMEMFKNGKFTNYQMHNYFDLVAIHYSNQKIDQAAKILKLSDPDFYITTEEDILSIKDNIYPFDNLDI